MIRKLLRPLVLGIAFLAFASPAFSVDLVITATSVLKGTGATVVTYDLGETVTAGQALYLHTDGLVYKTDVDAVGKKDCIGIALNGGAISQPVRIQTGGTITIGATTVVGTLYVASNTAGGIAPSADIATGWDVIVIGVGGASNTIIMNLWDTGVAKP